MDNFMERSCFFFIRKKIANSNQAVFVNKTRTSRVERDFGDVCMYFSRERIIAQVIFVKQAHNL
jgi:hypothetical protein